MGGGYVGLATKSCLTLVTPWTVARQAPLSRDFSGKKAGVGFHFPLHGIFQTQGWNLGLRHCRQIPYRLSPQGTGWCSILKSPKDLTPTEYYQGLLTMGPAVPFPSERARTTASRGLARGEEREEE